MSDSGSDGGSGAGDSVVRDEMRYDLLVEAALKEVVRMALHRVQRSGLPGEHHFYIAFDTRHPGVRMSDRLRQKYPEEMTIVLQHQFWGLKVHARHFEVGLAFGGVEETLLIPYDAITGFFDPSVQFALQFRRMSEEEQALLGETRADGEGLAGGAEGVGSADVPRAASDAGDSGKAADDADGKPQQTEKVVQLDVFRKKK